MDNKNALKITGYSDDLIEVEGSINDEFSPSATDDTAILTLPDGGAFKVFYDNDGIWRVEPFLPTVYRYTLEKGDVGADTNDVLTIHEAVKYVLWSCADETKGVLGEITLTDDRQILFDTLKKTFDGEDMFSKDGNLLKAILSNLHFN